MKFGHGPILLFSRDRCGSHGGPPSSQTDRNPVTRAGRRFSGNGEGARTAATGYTRQTTTVVRPSSATVQRTRRLHQLRRPIAVAATGPWRGGWAVLPDRRATATADCRPAVGPLESSDRPAPDRPPPSLRPRQPRGLFHATRARAAERLHVCPHPCQTHTHAHNRLIASPARPPCRVCIPIYYYNYVPSAGGSRETRSKLKAERNGYKTRVKASPTIYILLL